MKLFAFSSCDHVIFSFHQEDPTTSPGHSSTGRGFSLTLVGDLISLIRHRAGKYCTDRDGKLPVEEKTLIQINALSCSREQPLKATVPQWRPHRGGHHDYAERQQRPWRIQ
jgi:hypothetical protein